MKRINIAASRKFSTEAHGAYNYQFALEVEITRVGVWSVGKCEENIVCCGGDQQILLWTREIVEI